MEKLISNWLSTNLCDRSVSDEVSKPYSKMLLETFIQQFH